MRAVIFAILIFLSALDAQGSSPASEFGDQYFAQLDALNQNPNLKLFGQLTRPAQLQLIKQAEVIKLRKELTAEKGTYDASALAVYDEAVKTLSSEERFSVDAMVLRAVWNSPQVDDADIKKISERFFAKTPAGDSVSRIEAAACALAQDTASISSLVQAPDVSNQDNTVTIGGALAAQGTDIGTRRFANFVTPDALGAARHVVCKPGEYTSPLFANKSLGELQAMAKLALDQFRQTNPPPPLSATRATAVGTSTTNLHSSRCTLTQIHDALVDGERVLRTNPGTRYITITNRNGCGVFGDLTRETKTGMLKVQIRPYTPGAPSTYQEGKDLSSLVKKIFDWQESLKKVEAKTPDNKKSGPSGSTGPALTPASATRR